MNRKSIEDFTKEEKLAIYKFNKWTIVEGWCLDFEQTDEGNIVVGIDEITKHLKEGTKFYVMEEYGDCFHDMDDAWEHVIDEVYNIYDLDCEINDINLISKMEEHLEKATANAEEE